MSFTDEIITYARTMIDSSDNPHLVTLHDALTELDQIVVEANHPDAVAHAESAIRSIAKLWMSDDTMDARYAEYHGGTDDRHSPEPG